MPTLSVIKRRTSVYQRLNRIALRSGLTAGTVLFACQMQAASQTLANKVSSFSISAETADTALIAFARQADLTVMFPFNKVRDIQANALEGEYTVKQAIDLLLLDTGLEASFTNKGTLSIQTINQGDADSEPGLLARLAELFTDSGDNMVTFPEQQNDEYELILVKGIRGSMQRSVDLKYSETGIVDGIKAEEIGKFPDSNLAESIQRLTGVSIDRSEGEGQFVTVRGFGPQFNTVLTNGRRLATDNQGREFSFDTLASEMVSGVTIDKTFSADQQSGGIGSTINIQTARPFSHSGFKVAGSVSQTYDTNSHQLSPQGSILMSHSNNTVGWLVSYSHQERESRIHEVQTDGWLLNTNIPQAQLQSTSDTIFVPRNYDQRVRFDTRKRSGGTVIFQYSPHDDVEISLDYLKSSFDVETNSTSMGHWFTSSNLENVVTDENGTVVEFEQTVGHATDFHARTFDRPSDVSAKGMILQWYAQPGLKLDFDISLSRAAIEDTDGRGNALSLIGYLNRSRFDHTAGNVLPAISGFEQADPTILDASGEATGVGHYLDPANGRAHVMLRRGWNIRDNFDQYAMRGDWDPGLENLTSVEFGVMLTRQRKRNERWDNEENAVHCTFCGYFNSPDIPDAFQFEFAAGSDFLSNVSGHQHIPKVWLRHDGGQLFGFLEEQSGVSFDAVQRNNSFTINEDVQAAYVQLEFADEWRSNQVWIEAGLRYEGTEVNVEGVGSDLLALTVLDQTELGQITTAPVAFSQQAAYHNWLPSVSAKITRNDWVARLAVSKSLTRPTMTQMSPSLVLNTTRQGGDLRASRGSPQLKPFESTNFDLGLEWYYAHSSYASVGYYRKNVDNFIVSTVSDLTFDGVTDPSTGNDPTRPDAADQLARFDLTQPVNGETAAVYGWELALQHTFDSGVGVIANMTLVDSNAQLDRNNVQQKFALTGLSDSQNLIVFYEKGPAQVRFAWNHREQFLQSLIQIQGPEPTFVDSYQQLDMSASYALNDHVTVFMEGINITNEYLMKHGRFDNQLLLVQDPGARYTLGIRGSF